MRCLYFDIFDAARFWSFVEKKGPEDCWLWSGDSGINSKRRYGNFSVGRKTYLAHRVSFFLSGQECLDSDVICHSCDVTRCVNPAHLFAGTQLVNRQNCAEKHRTAIAEGHGNARLSNLKVLEILDLHKENGYNRQELSKIFNIPPGTIGHILDGSNWSSVTGVERK